MSEMKRSPNFHVGDLVRVKHGVADVDYPDIPMGGWVGRISKVEKGTYLIRWSIETLENVHPVYRKRCERDGVNIEEYWVSVDNLEPAPIEPLNMEQPTAIITRPLSVDNQGDRICMAYGLTSDDPLPYDSKATELSYFNYLKTNLTFPFPAQFFDPIKDRKREVTVTGMCDDFPLDEGFGVMCEVLDGGEKGQMPLSELEVESGNPNHQMVDDYITWFVNVPEAGVDDDLDGDWGEELEDEELEDEEDDLDDKPAQDYEEESLPSRQKAGRNDPCPCGSGKKFKKCCLGKEQSQQEKEIRSKFPIGTIALYGPDDKRTTKIAAAVIKREGADPILNRWVGTNVEDNPKVQREIQEFFKKHGVKSVVATDRNMGCPHEEGEDFPVGGDCPFCPWWKGKQGSGAKE
jgi:hypothetical protein